MSRCGGGCSCGPGCGCGSGCSKYPDVEKAATTVIIEGVAPVMNMKTVSEESAEKSNGAEGAHACTCKPYCSCKPKCDC